METVDKIMCDIHVDTSKYGGRSFTETVGCGRKATYYLVDWTGKRYNLCTMHAKRALKRSEWNQVPPTLLTEEDKEQSYETTV